MWLLAQKYQILLPGNTILKRLDSKWTSDVNIYGWNYPFKVHYSSKLFQDAPLWENVQSVQNCIYIADEELRNSKIYLQNLRYYLIMTS